MTVTPYGRRLGAKRSPPDDRDHRYPAKLARGLLSTQPVMVDLSAKEPPVWDQAWLGSCEAHAGAARMTFMYPGLMASRLAIYYAGRAIEGHPFEDTGIYTRDLMKVLRAGVYAEDQWPYDLENWSKLPPVGSPAYYIGSYSRLGTADEGLDCLIAGDPFVFAIEVPGAMDGPAVGAHGILNPIGDPVGEHCMLAVGYDLDFKNNPDFLQSGLDPEDVDDAMIKARNSWGQSWGLRGHVWLPLSYVFHPATGNDAWACHPPPLGSTATAQGAVSGVPIVGHFV